MKYIGNFKEWIQQSWIDYVLTNSGTGRFRDGKRPDSAEEQAEFDKSLKAGYSLDKIYFWMFDKHNTNFTINPPFVQGKSHWWITKMMPGDLMPVHVDPHTLYEKNSKRFWMPWQDWEPGHVFVYKDITITNYRAGDVWMYEDATAVHGAANIGHTPRVVLQVSSYDQ